MSYAYQKPPLDPGQFPDYRNLPPQPSSGGMVQQVRVVAMLNLGQGILELILALLQIVFAFAQPALRRLIDEDFRNNPDHPIVLWFMTIMYVALALPLLIGGTLRIVASIRNYQLKSRILGIVSLGVGMVSVLTCCAPTAIGVLVYGLIVYLDRGVIAAFRMGREGRTSSEILAAFGSPKKG